MDLIDKASMPRLYSASGYNRNMARALIEAPLDMGGAGFVLLRIYAYSGWIIHFIKNWRTPSEELRKFLCISYAWVMENVEVSFPILKKPDVPLPHLQG